MQGAGVVLLVLCACSVSPTEPIGPPSPSPPDNVAGNWTLTLDASSVCSQLPEEARHRSYTAAITQNGAQFVANLLESFDQYSVRGTVAGNAVTVEFSIHQNSTNIVIEGAGQGTVTEPTIAGNLSGTFYTQVDLDPKQCNALDHRFKLTRR
jgi:hypothetical protein